jgi:hypothetical protein
MTKTECKWDFDYEKCFNPKCQQLVDCRTNYLEKRLIKRSDEFKSLIGNYELFD